MEINIKESKRKSECYHSRTRKFHDIPSGEIIVQFIHKGCSGKSSETKCIPEGIRNLKEHIKFLQTYEKTISEEDQNEIIICKEYLEKLINL